MLLLRVDERSTTPLHRQIRDKIEERILNGALRAGERLPSTRALGERLGVHRTTVALAYQQLWSRGFIDLRPAARPRVRERTPLVRPRDQTQSSLIDWRKAASSAANVLLADHRTTPSASAGTGDGRLINFTRLEPDRRLLPVAHLQACLRRALSSRGVALVGYGEAAGYRPLRVTLSRRLAAHGIAVPPDELLLTNGAHQAIDLLFRMVAAPGRSVAFESPTYGAMLPLLRFHGLKPVEIPLGPDGMDLDGLETAMRREPPALVYTMPTFQNPTGISTAQAHRERLLALCEAKRVPLVEDGFEEEMQYSGRVVLPVKSMDRRRVVVYCGTFSKVLFPGVRIGWVAADRDCVERLTAIRRFQEIAPATLLHAALDEFCRDGSYDRHLARMHRVFKRRMQLALELLREHVRPEWAEWSQPAGGFLIWLRLKPLPASSGDLAARCARHGVAVTPGSVSFYSRRPESYLRLSIASLNEDEIRRGVLRLERALHSIYSRRRP